MNFLSLNLLIICPLESEITDIPVEACPEQMGQIQKIVFMRRESAVGTLNKMVVSSADPTLLASWTTILTATDSTKVQVTPLIHNPEFDPGEPITDGGGNATAGGIEIVTGQEDSTFTYEFIRVKQTVIAALKGYNGEDMAVYFIDEHGHIWGLSDVPGGTMLNFLPIPVRAQFFSDKKPGGLEEADRNFCRLSLLPNWSDDLVPVVPADFDALVELSGS